MFIDRFFYVVAVPLEKLISKRDVSMNFLLISIKVNLRIILLQYQRARYKEHTHSAINKKKML